MQNKQKIGEEDVEQVVGNVASSIRDSHVDINIVRRFFDEDGWLSLQHIVESRKNAPWVCGECQGPLEDDSSICCDSCLSWGHLRCTGLKKPPKIKFWFCKECKSGY